MRQPNKVSGQAKNEGDNANRKVANPTNLAHAHTAPVEPQQPFQVNGAPIDVCDAASIDQGFTRASGRPSTLWSMSAEPIMRSPWPTT